MNDLPMSGTTSKLKWGIFWNVFGSVGSKILMMLASLLTARILGADRNGEFAMINSTVGMFSTFAVLGLGTTAMRFVVEFKESNKKRCGNIIAMTFSLALIASLLVAVALIVGSDWMAKYTLNNENLSIGLKLSTIMLIFNTVNTIQNSILSGFENFKAVARVAIIQGAVSVPIFVVFTLCFGVNGLIIGYGFVGFVVLLVANSYIKKSCKENSVIITYKTCFKEYRLIFKFALPAMLMNIVVIPITWLGNTIVINNPNGYYDLGVFNAANQWRTAISLLPTAIGNVILPFIISRDDENMEDVNILLSWFIVLAISSCVIFSSGILALFYGDSYDYTQLNCSIIIICAICGFLSFKEGIARNLIKYSYMWFGFFSNLLWGVCFILSILFFKKWNAVGISCAYLFSYFITTIVFVPFYIKRKVVNRKYFFNTRILTIWAVFVMYLFVALLFDSIWIKGIFLIVMISVIYWGFERFFNISNRIMLVLKKNKR